MAGKPVKRDNLGQECYIGRTKAPCRNVLGLAAQDALAQTIASGQTRKTPRN